MVKSMLTPKYKATVNHKMNEHLPFCTFHSNLNKPLLLPLLYTVKQTCRNGSIQLCAAAWCNWSNLCHCGVKKAVAQSAILDSVDAAGSGSYINKCASDSCGNLSNLLLDCHRHRTICAKVIFTIPLHFNAGEEVYTAEAQGMSRNQGYIHLQKWEQKRKEQK